MKRIPVVRLELVKERNLMVENKRITGPDTAFEILTKYMGSPDREHFVIMCLDTKNQVACLHTVSIGTLNSTQVHPREVFKVAIMSNSAAIIIGHNHPSGDPTPSQQDVKITERLAEAGRILGIEILDHIVCGDGKYVSLKTKGII